MHRDIHCAHSPVSSQDLKNIPCKVWVFQLLTDSYRVQFSECHGLILRFCLCGGSYQARPLPPQTFTELQSKHTLPVSSPFRSAEFLALCERRVFRIEDGSCVSDNKRPYLIENTLDKMSEKGLWVTFRYSTRVWKQRWSSKWFMFSIWRVSLKCTF